MGKERDAIRPARPARPSECSGLIETPPSLLVERARRRDEDALVTFFGRHERALFAYFSGPMHWHWSFVPDLVQETITRAIKAFPTFRGATDAQAERWLFGIARNVHLQEVSRQVGIRLRKDVAFELARHRREVGEVGNHDRADLLAALSSLPLGQLEVLRLMLEGMTIREIGEALDLPDGTVATRIHRARRRLREALEHNDA